MWYGLDNLPDEDFKIMTIKMLTKFGIEWTQWGLQQKGIRKYQMKVTGPKNIITKLKIILKWSKNKVDEAGGIRELIGKHSIRAQSMKKLKIAWET